MKQLIAVLLVNTVLISPAMAQMSLQEQINAVDRVHQQHKAREAAAYEAALEQERLAKAARERKEREHQQRIAAQQAAKEKQMLQDKQRDQSFEDNLRELEIEQRRLELEMQKAKVKRYDEYIDQELKSQAAHTDVIQSGADATRNISEGSKTLLESEGKARVKKAGDEEEERKGWLGF